MAKRAGPVTNDQLTNHPLVLRGRCLFRSLIAQIASCRTVNGFVLSVIIEPPNLSNINSDKKISLVNKVGISLVGTLGQAQDLPIQFSFVLSSR